MWATAQPSRGWQGSRPGCAGPCEVQDARRRALVERIVAVALIGLVVLTRAAAVGWLVGAKSLPTTGRGP
jgi:hypothetical protein